MIDVDKWQEILDSISRHKLRTALTAFGVAWGIFTLVLMLGAIDGLVNSFEHDFRDDAVNSLWLWSGRTSKDYNGLNSGRRINFDNSDYDFLIREFEEIDAISGRFHVSSDQLVSYGKESLALNVRAVHPGHKVLENSVMIAGRYLNDKDIEEGRKVAIIGKVAKKNLLKEDEAIGNEIRIGNVIYKVVGVFYDSGGENEMKRVYIPISTAQNIYADGKRIHQLMLSGGDLTVAEMRDLETKVRAAFAERKGYDPTDRQALYVNNRAENFEQFNSLFEAFTALTWIIGFFSIMAGVIGVSNIMLIIVKDRTKEIGIRKAIGATPGSIVAMVLQESILITAVAGYLGMLAGIAIIFAMNGAESEYFRHPTVDVGIVAIATLLLVISGALAGLLPALKAARINPVIAIKD